MEVWKRTLVLTSISQVFSIIGFNFVVPFIPLYIQHLGVRGVGQITLWAALLSGGTALCMAVAAPIWGTLADRHGRKIMVARAGLSAAVLIALMGFAQNVYQLLILRMLQGAFTGTVSASQALVASQAPKDRLGFSMGVMQTAIFFGTSVGPLLGGIVVESLGFRPSFWVAAALLLVGGLLVALFVHEERASLQARTASSPTFFTGLGNLLKAPALPAMIASVFAVQFALTVVFPVLPQFIQYLQGPGGHTASVTGLIFAGAGVAGAISSVSVGYLSDRVGYKAVLVGASAGAALLSIPQYFVTQTWQIAALRIAIGFAVGAILPSSSALIATLVPSEQRGTAYGLSGSATSLGFGAGPLTAAAVVSVAGIRPVFLTASVVLGVIAVWVATMVHLEDDQGGKSERVLMSQGASRRGAGASPALDEGLVTPRKGT
ncbi:MAG: MFS transporter [Chloroflexota bacterium]